MGNYKSRGVVSVIETYEASIDEAVKTFTFSGINFNDISELYLIMDGSFDGAGNLMIAFNGITANYFTDGTSTVGGTITAIDLGTAASSRVGVLDGVDDVFQCRIFIRLSKGAAADYIEGTTIGNFNGDNVVVTNRSVNDATEITSIEITTSANKWQAGTRFTLYKVSRS